MCRIPEGSQRPALEKLCAIDGEDEQGLGGDDGGDKDAPAHRMAEAEEGERHAGFGQSDAPWPWWLRDEEGKAGFDNVVWRYGTVVAAESEVHARGNGTPADQCINLYFFT